MGLARFALEFFPFFNAFLTSDVGMLDFHFSYFDILVSRGADVWAKKSTILLAFAAGVFSLLLALFLWLFFIRRFLLFIRIHFLLHLNVFQSLKQGLLHLSCLIAMLSALLLFFPLLIFLLFAVDDDSDVFGLMAKDIWRLILAFAVLVGMWTEVLIDDCIETGIASRRPHLPPAYYALVLLLTDQLGKTRAA